MTSRQSIDDNTRKCKSTTVPGSEARFGCPPVVPGMVGRVRHVGSIVSLLLLFNIITTNIISVSLLLCFCLLGISSWFGLDLVMGCSSLAPMLPTPERVSVS